MAAAHSGGARVPEELRSALTRYFGERGAAFASELPAAVDALAARWALDVGRAIPGARTAFVAHCRRADGSDAVLRVVYPERPPGSEAEALRTWAGHGSVRLLETSEDLNALLVERCCPGAPLSTASDVDEILIVGSELLARLWGESPREPRGPGLGDLAEQRATEAEHRSAGDEPLDDGLVAEAISLWRELPRSGAATLLHADFTPRNVLSAERERWLVIDPKPLVGDPCYELAPLITGAGPADDEEIARRVRVVCSCLSLESSRVAAWGVARSVDWALFCSELGDTQASRRAGAVAAAFSALV